ncbi:MAG: hypothetical protein NTY01_04560 [Verrucomicrobia bacterium]|nr:hypothetical protein [Verrucomicrobiota bacterium]
MTGASAIERTGLESGSSHTSLWRLLGVLFALWAPSAFLGMFILINQGPNPLNGPREMAEAGGQSAEPRGDLVLVLTVPISILMQAGALWWGGATLVGEYRRHTSRHRRRRRRLLDKLLQRVTTVFIAISMVATIPAFVWCLVGFAKLCIPFSADVSRRGVAAADPRDAIREGDDLFLPPSTQVASRGA